MALEHKNAVGWFANQQQTESAISQLKSSGFSMERVSVVAQHSDSENLELETLTGSEVESQRKFDRDRNTQPIEHGALDGGLWGAAGGGLIAGLSALAFPAVGGAVMLIGAAAGSFYGAVSGGLLGGALGRGLSDEQAKQYDSRIAAGDYLVVITGSDQEIAQAKPVLTDKGIQDWAVFDSL